MPRWGSANIRIPLYRPGVPSIFVNDLSGCGPARSRLNVSVSVMAKNLASSSPQPAAREHEVATGRSPPGADVVPDQSTAENIPAWFLRRKERLANERQSAAETSSPPPVKRESGDRATTSRARPVVIQVLTENVVEDLPWREQLKRWMHEEGMGFGISFAVHSLILLILAFCIVQQKAINNGFGLTLTQYDAGNEASLDTILSAPGDAGGGDSVEVTLLSDNKPAAADAVHAALPNEVVPELKVDLHISAIEAEEAAAKKAASATKPVKSGDSGAPAGKGPGRGKGTGPGGEGGYGVPGGGKVVTKGSFSVWTVPANPRPFQSYLIIVQVDMKGRSSLMLKRDRDELTGTVEGSDRYFQVIENTGFFVPKVNQMVIPVPGAERALVRDVIRVRSKTLNESQELTITFGAPPGGGRDRMRRGPLGPDAE